MAADLNIRIGADTSGLQDGLRDAERRIDEFVQNVEKIGKLGDAIESLGKKLTYSLTVPIIGLATAAIKAYGDIQALQKGLEAVMGSAERASREFDNLKEVAKLPGLGMEEAVRGSINLQSIGFSAKNASNILQKFGNAVATVGKGRAEFERAIYGVQQLANTKFPLGEDLNIIKDAIPQVSRILTEAFGTSRSDELAKLGITSKQVLDVILKGLEKLPKVSGGIKGAFENLSDSLKTSLGRIGKIIDDNLDISGIIDKVTKAIDSVITSFENLDPTLQKIILGAAGFLAAAGPLLVIIGGFMAALPSLISGFGALSVAFTALTGPIGLVALGIIAIVTAVVANWDKIKPYLDDAILRFKILYNESTAFRLSIATVGFVVETVARVVIGALKIIYENFKDVGKGILKIFSAIGEQIEGVFTLDFEKIGRGTINGFKAVGGVLSDTMRNGVSGIIDIGKSIEDAEKRWSSFRFSLTEKIKLGKIVDDEGKDDFPDPLPIKDKDKKVEIELIPSIKFNRKGLLDEIGREFETLTDLTSNIAQRDLVINATVVPFIDFDGALKKATEAKIALSEITKSFNEDFNNLINNTVSSGLTDMFTSIGEAIGQGGDIMGAVGSSLLNLFAGFLSDMGSMLIKYGTLAIMKGTLDLIIQTGGYQAIAAGVAAIAVGAALSIAGGALGKRSTQGMSGGSGGGVSTGTGSGVNNNYSGSYTSGGSVSGGEVVFRIAGNDLVGVLNRATGSNNRLNAG